ncbi:RES family NAD+ phosphorylase [Bacteroidota bacterium]
MKVYRLSKAKYVNDLSGIGAGLTGGRWNRKGTKLVYTADSRALCTAEIAVHTPIGITPSDYYLITIEIPDDIKIYSLDLENLPDDWKGFPHSEKTQKIGEDFVSNREFLVMKVPSAVVQGDFNYLINPKHIDFGKIRIMGKEKFTFDERLFKRKSTGSQYIGN